MSSATEELANAVRSALSSPEMHASLPRAMSEVLRDHLTVQKSVVNLETMEVASERYTPKRMPSHLQLEVEFQLRAAFSIQLLLPVENAQSSSSTPEYVELSSITHTEILEE